jgi:hypothetical protein
MVRGLRRRARATMSRFVKEGPEGGALEAARGGAEAAALLDSRVAAGLQAKLLDGGTLVQGLQSRSRSSRPFTEPNRLPPLHRAVRRLAGTPRRGAAAQGRRRCEAMDRAALLLLLQAEPPVFFLCSTAPPRRRVRNAR